MQKKLPYLGIFIFALLLQGCNKPKPVVKITETHKVNKWVYEQMGRNYLWSASLPEREATDLSVKTENYFEALRYRANKSVLYSKDTYGDRFSQIKFTGDEEEDTETRAATEKTYDFGLMLSRIINPDKSINHIQILYVVPGSPAEEAGLLRGDCFDKINGTKITLSNISSLLAENSITVRLLNRETEGEITIKKGFYYNYPILVDMIYEESALTAYLAYNHFTDGGSAGYAAELKEAFARYKAAGARSRTRACWPA